MRSTSNIFPRALALAGASASRSAPSRKPLLPGTVRQEAAYQIRRSAPLYQCSQTETPLFQPAGAGLLAG